MPSLRILHSQQLLAPERFQRLCVLCGNDSGVVLLDHFLLDQRLHVSRDGSNLVGN